MKAPWAALLVTGILVLGSEPAPPISTGTFRHHFIATDIPQKTGVNPNFGTPVLADFDKDGDLDFAVSVCGDKLYWFENTGADAWTRHVVGELPLRQLGAAGIDVDGDGWTDIVVGGYWFRNPGQPAREPFQRFLYDASIRKEVHDIVAADVDGDGKPELVESSDEEGCFWYKIPSQPARDADWQRHTITMAVLNGRDDIHGGIAPHGAADLDSDGDPDLALTDRWLENRNRGTEWKEHPLPWGKRGPYGLSSRGWIADINRDGHPDIVVADSDQQGSRAGWLESDGKPVPSFTAHLLPLAAPGTRGSFHSLVVADFDADGDLDIFTVEQEDSTILPVGAKPRWYVWENVDGRGKVFAERVIFDGGLGGHDVIAADIDGDGDLDLASKVWSPWQGNANGGRFHADWFENLRVHKPR